LNCHYTLHKSKLIFNFTPDDPIHFTNLLKLLPQNLTTPIQLTQIPLPHQPKLLPPIPPSPPSLSSSTFLAHFQPLSIKIPKHQNLSLNPTNISPPSPPLI
ncbi:PSP1 C-terminal domain-containing protein, partial [Staphylococcus hominis]|uniref:PSP1 C-terminal domain-containing protein n=1 Tax=Staphylococcus hominis TaxID=1290 RepID=UPI0021B5D76B